MKNTIALILMFFMVSIQAQEISTCPEQRAMMCTMDYTPVCALNKDKSVKTYSNACTACADKNSVSHVPGICPPHTLNAAEVTTLFSDNTYSAVIPSRKLSMDIYVDPDGTIRGMQAGHKFAAKWQVNEQGQICVSYRDKMNCRFVMLEEGQYKKYKLDDQGKKVVLVVYQSFASGNIHNY